MATKRSTVARRPARGETRYMDQRQQDHREPRYKGEGYGSDGRHGEPGGYSGSPAHRTETRGPGPVPGAGQIDRLGPGPGPRAARLRADQTENPGRKTPTAKSDDDDAPAESGEEG